MLDTYATYKAVMTMEGIVRGGELCEKPVWYPCVFVGSAKGCTREEEQSMALWCLAVPQRHAGARRALFPHYHLLY